MAVDSPVDVRPRDSVLLNLEGSTRSSVASLKNLQRRGAAGSIWTGA